MRRSVVFFVFSLLASSLTGCAGTIRSSDDLKNQGYQLSRVTYTTATGESREGDKMELWWKESREGGRAVHFCTVPRVPNAGYQWAIHVYVDNREAWTHDAGYSLPGRAGLRTGVDCASSSPLPDGRLNWRFFYRYWH